MLLLIRGCQVPTGNCGRSAKVEKSLFLPNLKMFPLKLLLNSKIKHNNYPWNGEIENTLTGGQN